MPFRSLSPGAVLLQNGGGTVLSSSSRKTLPNPLGVPLGYYGSPPHNPALENWAWSPTFYLFSGSTQLHHKAARASGERTGPGGGSTGPFLPHFCPLPISGYRHIYPSSDNLPIYRKGATSQKCHSRGSWEGASTPASYFPPFPKALLIHHAEKVPRVRTEGLPPLSLTSKWPLLWSSGTSSGRNVGVP